MGTKRIDNFNFMKLIVAANVLLSANGDGKFATVVMFMHNGERLNRRFAY